jgi:hypothetical protein
MKNLIKIFSAIFIITIAVVAINCSTGSKTEGNDTTTVAVDTTVVSDTAVVDTTKVSGGAGVSVAGAPVR